GAAASVGTVDAQGKPHSGSVSILRGTGAGGAGWYLDPNPYDLSRFRSGIINAFAGAAGFSDPPRNLGDLFTVVASEMAHTVGLINDSRVLFRRNPQGYLVNTGVGDMVFPGRGRLFTFTGPSVTALYTSNNGGPGGSDTGWAVHLAEPGNRYTNPVT